MIRKSGHRFSDKIMLKPEIRGNDASKMRHSLRERTMSDAKIREEICRFGRSLFERGLTPGSSGNISVKLDDGGWLVTPTNASLGFLDPARLSRLGPDGRLVSGDAPTKEVPLHTALYQTRGAAGAVVHLHSTHSVALSMLPEIDPRAAARLPSQNPSSRARSRPCAVLRIRTCGVSSWRFLKGRFGLRLALPNTAWPRCQSMRQGGLQA